LTSSNCSSSADARQRAASSGHATSKLPTGAKIVHSLDTSPVKRTQSGGSSSQQPGAPAKRSRAVGAGGGRAASAPPPRCWTTSVIMACCLPFHHVTHSPTLICWFLSFTRWQWRCPE
jgi:hypothetical protein